MNKSVGKVNILLKSVLRQPVRTLIFFLLIGVAAFAFVLRTTEFIVVRDSVNSIAENFHSIGFLQLRDAPYGNVLEGAEIIGASRYVGFEDRRRGAEAYLHGMHNTNTGGRVGGGGHIMTGLEVSHISVPERDVFSYFYAYVDRAAIHNHPATGHFVELRLTVDEVVAGYAEHAYDGASDYRLAETRVRWYMELDATENPLENIKVGERYFFRAAFYWVSTHGRGMSDHPPSSYSGAHILYMHPLTSDGLLYIHAPDGPLDFTAPGMEEIAASIGQAQYNASVLWLRTTADMTTMPLAMEGIGSISLAEGRFLNHEDYLQARPVAVIHQRLSQMRGLGIGDTITVSVPANQRIVNLNTVMLFGATVHEGWAQRRENFVFGEGFLDFAILGDPSEFMIEELELEIVGIYRKLQAGGAAPGWGMGYLSSLLSNYVYIPDSLLPPGFMPLDDLQGNDVYLWDLWYSFELADTRHENAFLLETRAALDQLGIIAHLIPSGAENFWISAEPVLLSSTINAVMFIVVMFLLFGLVSFLYLGQRRREFAILRALGNPSKRTVNQLSMPMALIGIPAIIAGGLFGWFFALNEAADTVGVFAEFAGASELYAYEGYIQGIGISNAWLAAQVAVMIVMMLAMVYAGAAGMAKRPVLELLQGRGAREIDCGGELLPLGDGCADLLATHDVPATQNGLNIAHQTSAKNRFFASLRFVIRHVARSPLKAIFTAGAAMFFIASLGLLQQAIVSTEREVYRLFDTTVVSGELVPSNPFLHTEPGLNVLQGTFSNLVEADFLLNYYAEAQFSDFFLIHPGEDGSFPTGVYGEFWDEFWHYIRHELLGVAALRIDPLFAFSDFDKFLYNHRRQDGDVISGIAGGGLFDFEEMGIGVVTEPLEVHFGAGFSIEDFVYNDPNLTAPVPVILSDLTLVRRELEVGDMAFLGHYFPDPWRASEQIEVPVQVIGWHNGNIDHVMGRNAVLIPMPAMEAIRGNAMSYTTFDFEVDPAFNRNLQHVRDELQVILRAGEQGVFMRLESVLRDEELRVVAGQMEQNLALMVLLYPVVIAASVVIGASLALLLLMQSAKIAAILRVLGYGRVRTRAMLSTEHIIVAVSGVIAAFIVLPAVGIGFTGQLPLLAGLYVLGATAGAVSGAVIITKRAPLELLQVRE